MFTKHVLFSSTRLYTYRVWIHVCNSSRSIANEPCETSPLWPNCFILRHIIFSLLFISFFAYNPVKCGVNSGMMYPCK
ncbi:hypothetical protein ZEAMMB73_Zm00001d025620 [Zea mays]|uniref:Uncharacterized protein n=1 Tax=Zea mays TaxID=4577 RepID=A0A1D6J849_MAIZE|nr:hypothetical protein ZEAMMB73_Zm00001d025620 [Zea mays]AQK44098.1 hypothetical protein ZEAMMB73_Zm00001d025620 [Zea mays]